MGDRLRAMSGAMESSAAAAEMSAATGESFLRVPSARALVRGRTGDPAWVRPALAGLLGAAALLMLYHYTLIRERRREDCFKAFLHNNWVGGAIFAGIAADYLRP